MGNYIGTKPTFDGYIQLTKSHRRNYGGTITEHMVIAEHMWGGPLPKGLIVHHLDENKTNNHINNLIIVSHAYHGILHKRLNIKNRIGKRNTKRTCKHCQKKFPTPRKRDGNIRAYSLFWIFCGWKCERIFYQNNFLHRGNEK